jgi:hypothetical protein
MSGLGDSIKLYISCERRLSGSRIERWERGCMDGRREAWHVLILACLSVEVGVDRWWMSACDGSGWNREGDRMRCHRTRAKEGMNPTMAL